MCGNGDREDPEGCDCGDDPNSLPQGCTDINGGPNANCTAECECMNTCGNGVVELCEQCDCGEDPNNLPANCTAVNGPPPAECSASCEINEECSPPNQFDPCDPTDPDACCPDPYCGADGYCESSAFTSPVCMYACGDDNDCQRNNMCFAQYGMCYAAFCGSSQYSMLGGSTVAPCQMPNGTPGWCLPLDPAKDDLGICYEYGDAAQGEACSPINYLDSTGLCRGDPTVTMCEAGFCSANDNTCLNFCDPMDVFDNNANSDYCPAGTNCMSTSTIDDFSQNTAGCRGGDYAFCVDDLNSDPNNGTTTCDLTNGQLIGNRALTCTDLDPDFECVMFNFGTQTDPKISWGTRIGSCADLMPAPNKAIWEVCDPQNDDCPQNSRCLEEDIFSPNPQGQTRCIPFCDTTNNTLCSDQHSGLPADNVCTSASYLFTGLVCTETDHSRLGFCACQAGGCSIGLCGNGVIDGTETCDGTAVGIHTCTYSGFSGGVMGCAATCDATDPTNCT